MAKVKKILAPTDFSDVSKLGLRHALELARQDGAEVVVYYVIDFDGDWSRRDNRMDGTRDLLARTRAALDNFLAAHFADCIDLVEVRQIVEFGAPHTNIPEKAAREGADLIVMATHGRTGVDHFMLGSVAEKVIARAPCPVLIVPPRAREAALAEAA